MSARSLATMLAISALLTLPGCGGGGGAAAGKKAGEGGAGGGGDAKGAGGPAPSFSLAWSEYPSWSVFGVAHTKGLIDGAAGKQGPVEKKWNVDIVLKQADYDPCLQMYNSSTCDAVCITNMDVIAPSLTRDSVAVLPTSTSAGADACIVVGIENVEQLRGKKVHGLEKTVSEYCFVRCLEKLGEKEADFTFDNMDPAVAAQAMQNKQDGIEAIMVWNPFVLQTLRTRQDAKVLFDSTKIPGEIIDMVVVGKDSLDKPGGKDFACAVIDTYYELNKLLADKAKGDETLVALGSKFSNLGLEDMKKVVEQTKFFATPDEGLTVLKTDLPKVMPTVVDFCVKHDIVKAAPAIGYGSSGGQLLFDPQYIEMVKAKAAK